MTKRDEYIRKMHAKLDEWNSDIDLLTAKTGKMKVEAQVEYEKHIRDLRSQFEETRKKLDDIERSRADAFADLKVGLERASIALGEAFESAKTRFKSREDTREPGSDAGAPQ